MVDRNKAAPPPPSAAERMSDGEKFMEDLKNVRF